MQSKDQRNGRYGGTPNLPNAELAPESQGATGLHLIDEDWLSAWGPSQLLLFMHVTGFPV